MTFGCAFPIKGCFPGGRAAISRPNSGELSGGCKGTVERIQQYVATYFDVPLTEILSDRRRRDIARPRQVAMLLSRRLTSYSLPRIARCFNRDHTTIMHGIANIERLVIIDLQLACDVAELQGMLSGGMGGPIPAALGEIQEILPKP